MSAYQEKDFEPPNGDLKISHVERRRADSTMTSPTIHDGSTFDHKHGRTDSNDSEAPYAEHGPMIDRSPTAEAKKQSNADLAWPRIRRVLREPFSEFLGTFILIMFGDGVVAQVVLSNGTHGDYQSISWGWGLGVMLGV